VLRNTVFYGNTFAFSDPRFPNNSPTIFNSDLLLNHTNNSPGFEVLLGSNSTFNASDGAVAGVRFIYEDNGVITDVIQINSGLPDTANFADLSGALASDVFTDINDPDGADDKFGTADDGLVPISISPLVDSGDNTANTTTLDLANVPRIYQTTIDKGAYEYFVDGVFLDGFE
jgi:hypothetical protein